MKRINLIFPNMSHKHANVVFSDVPYEVMIFIQSMTGIQCIMMFCSRMKKMYNYYRETTRMKTAVSAVMYLSEKTQ